MYSERQDEAKALAQARAPVGGESPWAAAGDPAGAGAGAGAAAGVAIEVTVAGAVVLVPGAGVVADVEAGAKAGGALAGASMTPGWPAGARGCPEELSCPCSAARPYASGTISLKLNW